MKITTVIADDHPLFRDGFKLALAVDPYIELLGEANSGEELLNLLEHLQPQIVMLDLLMPDMSGLEAARIIKEKYPAIKIVVLSMSTDDGFIKELWHLGINAYLLKDIHPRDMLSALHTVAAGGAYYSPAILLKIDRLLNSSSQESQTVQPSFSQTELRIMEQLCKGRSVKEISAAVGLAEKTVEHYKERIREKTGARNATEIAVYAVLHGLVSKEKLLQLNVSSTLRNQIFRFN